MDYVISVPVEQENCITAARTAHNMQLPAEVWDEPSGGMVPNPALIPDNAAYMDYVMLNAVSSYCVQYPLAPLLPDPTPAPTPAPPPARAR